MLETFTSARSIRSAILGAMTDDDAHSVDDAAEEWFRYIDANLKRVLLERCSKVGPRLTKFVDNRDLHLLKFRLASEMTEHRSRRSISDQIDAVSDQKIKDALYALPSTRRSDRAKDAAGAFALATFTTTLVADTPYSLADPWTVEAALNVVDGLVPEVQGPGVTLLIHQDPQVRTFKGAVAARFIASVQKFGTVSKTVAFLEHVAKSMATNAPVTLPPWVRALRTQQEALRADMEILRLAAQLQPPAAL